MRNVGIPVVGDEIKLASLIGRGLRERGLLADVGDQGLEARQPADSGGLSGHEPISAGEKGLNDCDSRVRDRQNPAVSC